MAEPMSDSDLLVIAATLAHECGIDAVNPDTGRLTIIQECARAQGKEVSLEMLTRVLKRAQMELLRRQLSAK